MVSSRNIFKFLVYVMVLCFVVTPALYFPVQAVAPAPVTIPAQDDVDEPQPPHPVLAIPIQQQTIFTPHWTTEGGFVTTFFIRNVHLEHPTTAKVSLLLDHRALSLPPVQIDALQTIAIDVEKMLAEAGEKIEQSGSAIIDFDGESVGAINAYAQVLDTSRSLSFSFPFMRESEANASSLDAVAWHYSKQAQAFFTLQNASDKEMSASPVAFIAGQPNNLDKVFLKPRETATVKIPVLTNLAINEVSKAVSIHIDYDGKAGALLAQGWVIDEAIGFSLPFAFSPPSTCDCDSDVQHKYGTGIMIGASHMTGPGTIFSPYLVASNRSEKLLSVKPLFSYATEKGIARVALPEMALSPQHSAVVNLREYQEQGLIPATVAMGDIDLQYKGEASALIAELTSVDQNGTFVSPVPLICRGARGLHMAYWRTDGDWHSSVTLQNIASKTNMVEITVSYPGGVYVFDKQIAAGETTMVSINDLQQSQEPDREGRRIPKEAMMGGVNIWSHNVNDGIVMNAMLMNAVTKTCGSCSGMAWVQAYSLSDKRATTSTGLLYGFTPHLSGEIFQMYINLQFSNGTITDTDIGNSSSSNGSVATVTGSSVNTGNPGTTTLSATTSSFYFTDMACSQGYRLTPGSQTLTVVTVNLQKADGTTLPNPFRVGISATTLGGTLHDRKQQLRVVVKPPGQVANISITVSNKLQKSGVVSDSGTGNITFYVVGTSKSNNPGDQTITIKLSGDPRITAPVSVVVPNNVSATHDTVGTGVVIANKVLDSTSSPAWFCLPPGQVQLWTVYLRYLTVTVCDQFGELLDNIYLGAEVSEFVSCDNQYHSINQPLTSSSTYTDPVGTGVFNSTVAAGSNQANDWPNANRLPFQSGCFPSGDQPANVKVDGFLLNPSIVNRSFTICGDGSSVTSPPVTLTVTWP